MSDKQRVEVPVGLNAQRWTTVTPVRLVLLIAHNVTTVTRLLDVIPAFDNDPKIQLVFTHVGADPFKHGLPEAIRDTGIISIPWKQAKSTKFDLAIAASHHGKLRKIAAPLVIISHGIGYTKYSPTRAESREPRAESREPRAESREPRAESREPRAESREPFGLSAEWVLHNDKPFAAALILSHVDQARQLAEYAPAAVSTAVVAGDPCYDRILASVKFRTRYRDALRIGNRRLLLISSTWSGTSFLGSRPEFLREILSELPRDSWAVAVALHPNTWHGHGPGQPPRWFADCLRAGALFLPELDGWRAGLIAADIVAGDFGSVTGYAAAIGKPTLLGAFDQVPPATPISALGTDAPRLPAKGPFLHHLTAAIDTHHPDRFAAVAARVSSVPGGSLHALRSVFYRLLELAEPPTEVAVETVPVYQPKQACREFADLVVARVEEGQRTIRLTRRPAEVQRPETAAGFADDDEPHLSCSEGYPVRGLVDKAAIMTGSAVDVAQDEAGWHRQVFHRYPTCVIAALVDATSSRVIVRDGPSMVLSSDTAPAEALASAVYAWRSAGLAWSSFKKTIRLVLGDAVHEVTVELF